MLLYMTSNQNLGIFDFMTEETGLTIKKLSGEFYLKKFVIHDMRSLGHYLYFAIDVTAIKDTDDEICEALQAFRKLYDTRIILFAEEWDKNKNILNRLIEEKIYNIVTAKTVIEIQNEIRKATSPEGMSYSDWKYLQKVELNSYAAEYLFKDDANILIAVAGVDSRCGTTTVAMNLVATLDSMGARVTYTEANESSHLNDIANYYDFDNVEGHYRFRGIEYYSNMEYTEDAHFSVLDLGKFDKKQMPILEASSTVIICGAGKPYEINKLGHIKEILKGIKPNYLLSFVPDAERHKLRSSFEDEVNLHFTEYSPSLFDGITNEGTYKKLLKNFYVET